MAGKRSTAVAVYGADRLIYPAADSGPMTSVDCAVCNATARPGDRFCAACGTPLPTDVTPSAPRQSVSGERKVLTVMFADTVDSTRLIENVDPELAIGRLQPVLDAMTDAVHAFGGTVSSVAGDGILALFGAPMAHEDHAVRASYAALQMLDDVRRATNGAVDIRVGLHSGEVLVRTIATDLSVDYTALGPPVHLASRMERSASPGQAVMTDDTARMAAGFIETQTLGAVPVRGLDEPVAAHLLVGRTSAVGTWMPRVRRDLTPFVGRDRELTVLDEGLRRARHGRGGVTAVCGEAGVGKSRLLHQFLERLPGEVLLWRLQASPYDVSTPYHPFVPLLRGTGERSSGADATGIRQRLVEMVGDDDLVDTAVEPLLAMVGGQPDSDQWLALDPPRRRRRIRDAIRAVTLAAARGTARVIVVEDLHWIDEDTRAVLDDIVELVGDAGIHLVVTYRPEYNSDWTSRTDSDTITLDPLHGGDAVTLLDVLIGRHASAERLRRALLSRTGGTPLFIEETVRALADAGALTGAPGRYRFVGDLDAIELPDTVQAVVAARADRLRRDDKQLLQIAAVIGETVPLDVLTTVSDQEQTAVAHSCDRLRAADFVHELATRSELSFKHNLIREVVYGEIPHDRRRALHGAVADSLVVRDSADPPIERLAYHSYSAERWDDATRYLWQAAQLSERRSAYPQQRRQLTMGLDAAAHLPETAEKRRRVIDFACALRVAATGSGQRLRSTLRDLDRAAVHAQRLGDQRKLATVMIHRSYVGSLTGDRALAIREARAAGEIGGRLDDAYLVAEGRLAEGQALALAGHPRGVPELLGADVDYLRTVGTDRRGLITSRIVTSLTFMSIVHAQMGSFDLAHRHLAERTAIARANGRPFELAFGAWCGGMVALLAGRVETAAEQLADGLAVSRLHDLMYTEALLNAVAGHAWTLLGDMTAAAVALDQAIESAGVMESPWIASWARVHRAHLRVLRGEPGAARADAEDALLFARDSDHPWLEATALRWLAATSDDAARTAACLRAAVEVCDRVQLLSLRRLLLRDAAHQQGAR